MRSLREVVYLNYQIAQKRYGDASKVADTEVELVARRDDAVDHLAEKLDGKMERPQVELLAKSEAGAVKAWESIPRLFSQPEHWLVQARLIAVGDPQLQIPGVISVTLGESVRQEDRAFTVSGKPKKIHLVWLGDGGVRGFEGFIAPKANPYDALPPDTLACYEAQFDRVAEDLIGLQSELPEGEHRYLENAARQEMRRDVNAGMFDLQKLYLRKSLEGKSRQNLRTLAESITLSGAVCDLAILGDGDFHYALRHSGLSTDECAAMVALNRNLAVMATSDAPCIGLAFQLRGAITSAKSSKENEFSRGVYRLWVAQVGQYVDRHRDHAKGIDFEVDGDTGPEQIVAQLGRLPDDAMRAIAQELQDSAWALSTVELLRAGADRKVTLDGDHVDKILARAEMLSDHSERVKLIGANLQWAADHSAKAMDLYQELQKNAKDKAVVEEAYRNAGLIKLAWRDDGAAALWYLDKALALNPDDALAQFAKARVLEMLSELTKSIQAYQRYLELQPTGPEAERAREAIRRLQQRLKQYHTS